MCSLTFSLRRWRNPLLCDTPNSCHGNPIHCNLNTRTVESWRLILLPGIHMVYY
jgi:hypothetical protein